MAKDIFDIRTLGDQESKEIIDARAARQSAYYARQIEAIELIEALKWCDLNRANEWISSHKERLTDAYALNEIIGMAMAYGVRDDEEKRSDARHEENRKKTALALKRWKELEAEGYSKNNAAEVIATEVNQKYSTVRKLLQGE